MLHTHKATSSSVPFMLSVLVTLLLGRPTWLEVVFHGRRGLRVFLHCVLPCLWHKCSAFTPSLCKRHAAVVHCEIETSLL